MLIEDVRASQYRLSSQLARFDDVFARLQDPAQALQALAESNSRIEAGVIRVDTRTEAMAQTLDGVKHAVSELNQRAQSQPAGNGPIFDNRDMRVGGSVYIASGDMHFGPTGVPVRPAAADVPIDAVAMRDWLCKHFDTPDELEVLCFELQDELTRTGHELKVSLSAIGAVGVANVLQAQRLIQFLDKRGLLKHLMPVARKLRSGSG